MKTIQKTYNSLSDMAQEIRTTESLPAWRGLEMSRLNTASRNSWAGSTWEEALELLENGDVKGAALIREAGDIQTPRTGAQPVARLNVRGCLPSVPNYLRGVPVNMLDIRREPRKTPVIDLYLNVCISAYITRQEAAEAARTIAGVVKKVESEGIRVNIYVGMINISSAVMSVFTKVKDSGAPLNLVNVAFPLTHPAFFRRVLFAWIEQNSKEYMPTYGHVNVFRDLAERGIKYEGVKIDLQKACNEHWGEKEVSDMFNEYLRGSK